MNEAAGLGLVGLDKLKDSYFTRGANSVTSAPAELGGEIQCLAKSSPYASPSAGAEVAHSQKWHVWCLLVLRVAGSPFIFLRIRLQEAEPRKGRSRASACLHVCMPACMPVCLYASVCLYVCMSPCLYVSMSLCLSVCLHVYMYVCGGGADFRVCSAESRMSPLYLGRGERASMSPCASKIRPV